MLEAPGFSTATELATGTSVAHSLCDCGHTAAVATLSDRETALASTPDDTKVLDSPRDTPPTPSRSYRDSGVRGSQSLTRVRTAVLVVSYNGRDDLRQCLESLLADAGRNELVHLLVWDNNSTDGAPEMVAAEFPSVTLLRSGKNLGYTGGGNGGWHWVQQHCPNAEYLSVLNQDIIVTPNWLDTLVEYLDETSEVGLAQPMICLEPERHLINNLGLRCHYLGFAYQLNYRDPADSIPPTPREVDAVSGAAFIVRTSFLAKYGLFSDDLFMYLEDVDLSWRVRVYGHICTCVSNSAVYHMYSPDSFLKHYGRLERNRLLLVAIYYPWPALVLLVPVFLFAEIVQCLWASIHGLLIQRLGVWWDTLSPRALMVLYSQRKAVILARSQLHLPLLCSFSGRIESSLLGTSWPFRFASAFFQWIWICLRSLLTALSSSPPLCKEPLE